jgi:hypothetical protein
MTILQCRNKEWKLDTIKDYHQCPYNRSGIILLLLLEISYTIHSMNSSYNKLNNGNENRSDLKLEDECIRYKDKCETCLWHSVKPGEVQICGFSMRLKSCVTVNAPADYDIISDAMSCPYNPQGTNYNII